MSNTVDPKRVQDLVRLLQDMTAGYEQLAELVQGKIDAMKQADIETMRRAAAQERELAEKLNAKEGLRRQVVDAIGEQLGLAPRSARVMTMSQLGSKLARAQRSALAEVGLKLRDTVARVAKVNRVAGVIGRGIHGHLDADFQSITTTDEPPVGYSGDGGLVGSGDNRLFDAVG